MFRKYKSGRFTNNNINSLKFVNDDKKKNNVIQNTSKIGYKITHKSYKYYLDYDVEDYDTEYDLEY